MEEMFLRLGEFIIPGNLLGTVSDKCDTAAIIPFWYSDLLYQVDYVLLFIMFFQKYSLVRYGFLVLL